MIQDDVEPDVTAYACEGEKAEIRGKYVSAEEDDKEAVVRNCCFVEQVVSLAAEEKQQIFRMVSSGKELWDKRESIYPHLVFCDCVKKQLEEPRNLLHIKMIMKKLQILEDYFRDFGGKFEKDKVGYGCREESETVKKNEKLRRMRVFELPDKRKVFFSWHISFICLRRTILPYDVGGREMRKKPDWKFIVPFLIAFAVFLVAVIKLGMLLWEYYKGGRYRDLKESVVSAREDTDGLKEQEAGFFVDFEKLRKVNPDVVGWIRIEKLGISYPIVQGEDNEYYLAHTFYKKENKCGSIFMEAENQGDFSDQNTFVYGHNMKDKSMFARLNEFREEDTFHENPEFYIYTPAGVRKYKIYSCQIAALGGESFRHQFSGVDDYSRWQEEVQARSLYVMGVEPKATQSTVTLMTCTPAGEGYRFLVHGALEEEAETDSGEGISSGSQR